MSMRSLHKAVKNTTSHLDSMAAVAAILIIGLVANYLAAGGGANGTPDARKAGSSPTTEARNVGRTSQPSASSVARLTPARPVTGPVFTAQMVFEAACGRRKVPGTVVLEKIGAVPPQSVPDNELLGSYVEGSGVIGAYFLKHGGKALKMTFSYTNEGDIVASYDSHWSLQGKEIENLIVSFGDQRFSYAYDQVPTWTKISIDPAFYENHILKPGQRVSETVWFAPCPPVKRCLIGDFELVKPITVELP